MNLLFCPISVLMVLYIVLLYISVLYITDHHSKTQCISYFVLFLYSWYSINGITCALHIAQVRSPESAGTLTGERKMRVYLDSQYILVLYITVLYLHVPPLYSWCSTLLYCISLYCTSQYISMYLYVSYCIILYLLFCPISALMV